MRFASTNIPLLYRHAVLKPQAEQLCTMFKLEYADKKHQGWLLHLDNHALSLHNTIDKQYLSIHFDEGKNDHRRRYSNGRQQPLSKAIGLDKPRNLSIIDTTAGFGRDAFMLASLGGNITLVERHAALAALLFDAMERATLKVDLTTIMKNMNLIHHDSKDYLQSLSPDQYPDVIYIDPMYPSRKKSALVKKDMQAAHSIIGPDIDSTELLDIAISTVQKRVVVKRPKGADNIANKKPSTCIQSKNTRYDIYTKAKLD